jgi:hypothetical protein
VNEPVLAAVEVAGRMVVLEPEEIVLYAPAADGWKQIQRVAARPSGALARDPRGVIVPAADGQGFAAWLSGTKCVGSASAGDANGEWEIECRPSDDPWPVAQPLDASAAGATPLRAFYNGTRDYFNGVVTPAIGIEPPAFYTAAAVPRPAGGAGLLIGGIDGLVQLAENGMLHSIAGTRDWGSDFAVLRSGCGAGTQMIAAGSGEALRDSLRAYELPALEAVPASAPLALNGTVTALWSAPDGKRAYAVVRNQANQYEVDRVTALCN